jgi:hypothetical protein
MARITTSATVEAGSALPTTRIYAIATGTITTAAACQQIAATYFGTIAAVEAITDGKHVMVEGGPGGAEAISGVSLVATFEGTNG